ncbi:MarR family transcriptional regulator [Kiloniella laminariae]|uniref:MarR family transcriptional regulator n=1 Tax=Kiloniella laminariae TaxID=454162 RepID=A0ABT4LP33_9PROT|nr:MarR family transcriptional regulator [Kiloniella laminariae]MCZ4282842.1 MarR family transcriptional regulator [Kiloniella laminariae]
MPENQKISCLEEQLCFALYSSSQAIIKKYGPFLSALDMTYPQYLAYLALEPKTQIPVKELGELLHLDSGTLSPLLKRMEKSGLVTRERSSEDERKVMVGLSAKARSLEGKIAEMQQAVACSSGLDLETFQQLLTQLKQLNNTLRQNGT